MGCCVRSLILRGLLSRDPGMGLGAPSCTLLLWRLSGSHGTLALVLASACWVPVGIFLLKATFLLDNFGWQPLIVGTFF